MYMLKHAHHLHVFHQVHCSLSAFLVGFHVHEKALLVPAVVSALLASRSRAGARMYLRLSFLAAFSVFPLLPGPELRVLKVARSLVALTHSRSKRQNVDRERLLYCIFSYHSLSGIHETRLRFVVFPGQRAI